MNNLLSYGRLKQIQDEYLRQFAADVNDSLQGFPLAQCHVVGCFNLVEGRSGYCYTHGDCGE